MSERAEHRLAPQRRREQRRRQNAEARVSGYAAVMDAMIASFVVVNVNGDHVMARRILPDGRLDAHQVPVGKPWWLRRSSMDARQKAFHAGVSPVSWSYSSDRRRTATRVADDEDNPEVMTPDFVPHNETQVGEVIVAIRSKCWIERDEVGDDGEVFTPLKISGEIVGWLMIGDGRAWATMSGHEEDEEEEESS